MIPEWIILRIAIHDLWIAIKEGLGDLLARIKAAGET